MKRLLLSACVIIAAALILGCPSTIMTAWYGPDLSPDELKIEVYNEFYTLGVLVAKKYPTTDTNEIISAASAVAAAADPENYLTQKWITELAAGHVDNAAIYYLARKALKLVKVYVDDQFLDPDNPIIDTADLDVEMFRYALTAFTDGVKKQRGQQ